MKTTNAKLLTAIAALLVSINVNAESLHRCLGKADPTAAIASGEIFDSEEPGSFMRELNSPEELGSYRIKAYSEVRSVKAGVLSIAPPYEGCMTEWTFGVVDYIAELPSGEVCVGTYAKFYKRKSIAQSGNCRAVSIAEIPVRILFAPFKALNKLDEDVSAGHNTSDKGEFKHAIKTLFQERMSEQ